MLVFVVTAAKKWRDRAFAVRMSRLRIVSARKSVIQVDRSSVRIVFADGARIGTEHPNLHDLDDGFACLLVAMQRAGAVCPRYLRVGDQNRTVFVECTKFRDAVRNLIAAEAIGQAAHDRITHCIACCVVDLRHDLGRVRLSPLDRARVHLLE